MSLRKVLAEEGLQSADRIATPFRTIKPSMFRKGLVNILSGVMGPASKLTATMGVGEFSNRRGMKIAVTDPLLDETFEAADYEDKLSAFMGLPVFAESTEDTWLEFTVQLA